MPRRRAPGRLLGEQSGAASQNGNDRQKGTHNVGFTAIMAVAAHQCKSQGQGAVHSPCWRFSMNDIPDLLERFRRGPEVLAAAVDGAGPAELDFSPAPGKWSIRQILAHVADTELVASVRFRQTLAEERPALLTFDQEAWARSLAYDKRGIADVLESLRRSRADNHELLRDLTPEAFSRAGVHPKRGETTLGAQLELFTTHTERHAGQIRTRRTEYEQAKAAE